MPLRPLHWLPRCLGALALGCSAGSSAADASPPADVSHRTDAATPTPGDDDPAYQVVARSWLMAGDGLTPRDEHLDVAVTAPAGVARVDAWLDEVAAEPLARGDDGVFRASLPAPAAGEHRLVLSADGGATAFASRVVHVSAALYAVVSVDWDDANPPQANLDHMDALRTHHPRLLYTQFIGPYVFTDPATTEVRREQLLAWIERSRVAGDELGVHIHPRCTYVSTTSVPCRTAPSDVYPDGDATGYTVILASYSADEQTTLLQSSAALMMAHGFGRPTSFRAGGWTADATTLAACERAGYAVESSAFPPETIQSAWAGTELARWTLEHWTGITPTSQPYYPSRSRVVVDSPAPNYAVLEVPDNGTLVDYMTAPAMNAVLAQNFPDGAPLTAPRVYQVGLHPGSFGASYTSRLEAALTEVDRHLAADDAGPVVYARLTELTRVWPAR